MNRPSTVKALAITAFVLCFIGLLIQLLAMIVLPASLLLIVGLSLWVCYAVSAFWGIRLSSYPLYPEEFAKVSWYMVGLCVACVVAMFTGFMVGFVLALALLAAVYSLKSNYDDWLRQQALDREMEAEQAVSSPQTGEVIAAAQPNSII